MPHPLYLNRGDIVRHDGLHPSCYHAKGQRKMQFLAQYFSTTLCRKSRWRRCNV